MANKMWGNEFRTTVVCVDSYENNIMTGRLYNPYLQDGLTFNGAVDFLKKTDALLDEMRFPQSFAVTRSFRDTPQKQQEAPPGQEVRRGKAATFALRILFRQNASWQGSVSWLEGEREETFRSVLELLFLMDSALHTD